MRRPRLALRLWTLGPRALELWPGDAGERLAVLLVDGAVVWCCRLPWRAPAGAL